MKNIVKGLALALIVVFAFTSCAKQPTTLMDAAKAAIQGVVDAKGGVYAKDELAKLNGDLQAALDAVNAQSKKFFKKYGPAKEMLTKLAADADAVKGLIPGRIAEAKAGAETAIGEAKMVLEEAKALLEKAPKGKGTKADIEAMKADLAGSRHGDDGRRRRPGRRRLFRSQGQGRRPQGQGRRDRRTDQRRHRQGQEINLSP